MKARTLLRTNGAKTADFVETLGSAAGAVAKAIEETAGPLAEMIEDKAGTLAKSVEVRATPLAEAVGTTVGALAKSIEQNAGPLAEAVGEKVDVLTEDLEEKLEQARKDLVTGVRNFKLGQREALILGLAVGVFGAVWLIRKIDREAAAERLRAAGTRVGEVSHEVSNRVGEVTHEMTNRVGEATQGLTSKAGTLAEQAGERVGQVVQTVGTRAGELVQQARGYADQTVEEAKQRLAEPASKMEETSVAEAPQRADIGSDLNTATQAAIREATDAVEQVQGEAQEQAKELALSNGMKVVAFDGTDIGRVQEVREDVFVLDRPKGGDMLVPLTEVARIEGTVAYLRIDMSQLTKMGWENAES